MKTKIATIFSIFIFIITLVGCSEDDDSNNSNQINITQATQNTQNGTWRISSFIDSGEDETNDFTGFIFDFKNDGSVMASRGELTVLGTWSINDSSNSSDDDDGSSDDVDFNLFFNVPESNDFDDLSDDWDITSISSSKIELIDVSGGNGGTDILVFEKI